MSVTEGSGNVFQDLGIEKPYTIQFKSNLMLEITERFREYSDQELEDIITEDLNMTREQFYNLEFLVSGDVEKLLEIFHRIGGSINFKF